VEVINVDLYGGKSIFGGRETPLEASVISCNKHNKCSYYKNGQCLLVRQFGSKGCKFGSVNTIRGYTSRAKKYSEFKRKWKEHEKYGKLSHPPTKLGVIDGYVLFPYPFVRIVKSEESNKWDVTDPSFINQTAYIPIGEFNSDLIYRICSYKPQAIMGGTIQKYQKETVPLFLSHLKELLPDKYEAFINTYPKFKQKEINYIGRKALLKTIAPSIVHYKSVRYPKFNESWEWDGEYLRYKEGHVSDFSVTKDYEIVEIVIKPTDKSTVVITSNEQVTENTVFVD
jgi:hypothetical protein